MPRVRKYIFVPYAQKDLAKDKGAVWDADKKSFYVPSYLHYEIFKQWHSPSQNAYDIDENKAKEQFENALAQNGLIVESAVMDGKLQRCKAEGDKGSEKSGAYVGYLDGYPAGYIENFKTGIKLRWKYDNEKIYTYTKSTTRQDQTRLNAQKELQETTALKLQAEYLNAKTLINRHPYLEAKNLKEKNLRVDKFNNLLIPLRDVSGKLWSLQRIMPNGSKMIGVIKTKEEKENGIEYLARKSGCFYSKVPLDKHDEFLLCEGYATAMSVQELVEKPTIMAIDAGNLMNVCDDLIDKYPDKQITIFADNDLKNTINVGLNAANKCKDKYSKINIVVPIIDEKDKNAISDFNDLLCVKGKEHTLNIITSQIKTRSIVKNEELER